MTVTHAAVLHEQMARHRADMGIPAISYALVRAGDILETGASTAEGHLQVDDTTRFRASSLTKSVTAATVLLLRDRGLLDLQDPVALHLDQASELSMAFPQAPVRIGHLLTMTGGLPTDDPWIDELDDLSGAQLLDMVASGVVLVRPPGSDYEYSNVGYALLGCVISSVTGTDFREVVAQEVLGPLGMEQTGFAVPAEDLRVAGHRSVEGSLVQMP